jgi:hypothetical protein
MLAVLAHALTAALRAPGYAAATPEVIQCRFPKSPARSSPPATPFTIQLERRAHSPVLRKASLPEGTRIPWLSNRAIHYEFS